MRKGDHPLLIEKTIVQMLSQKSVRPVHLAPILDWMYVEDHVNAYVACLEDEKAANQVFILHRQR
jgi:dTDP-D-glucose 4,6-dehydratase